MEIQETKMKKSKKAKIIDEFIKKFNLISKEFKANITYNEEIILISYKKRFKGCFIYPYNIPFYIHYDSEEGFYIEALEDRKPFFDLIKKDLEKMPFKIKVIWREDWRD